MKRSILCMLAIVLILSLAACANNNSAETKSNDIENKKETVKDDSSETITEEVKGPLFDEEVTFSMMIQSHPSWPYQEDWYVVSAIKERANVNFDINAIIDQNDAFREKLNLTMASGQVPDLIYVNSKEVIKMYGNQGAFLNVLDYEDQLPNFSKWKSENEEYVKKFMSADGSLYCFPEKGIEESNRRGWLYRDDIFEKHGIQIPTNEKELYSVLKQLKKLYPDSYPLTFRSGLRQFFMMAPSWGTDWQSTANNNQMYYDREADTWNYGPVEDNFKNMLQFLSKLYEEELIPPNFMSLTTKEWQDLISNDQGFITLDYLSRIDFFNDALKEINPEFRLRYMGPIKGGDNGVEMMAASATGFYLMIPSAVADDQDALLKYCDWLYTDEASELLSWGEEGKTYEILDGERKFIDTPDVASIRKNYGLTTYGFHILVDFSSHMSTFSPLVNEAVQSSRKYDLPEKPLVEFTDQELEVVQTVGINIEKHTQEEVSKFLLGIRDYNEWEQYVQELNDLGLNQLQELYEEAYKRQ